MKLRELNEQIATACGLGAKQIAGVQAETFRGIAAALEKGERVQIPDFGVFTVKDVEGTDGQPAKKVVRFRQRGEEDEKGERKKRDKKEAGKTAELAEAGE